jgi:hypothetical protein
LRQLLPRRLAVNPVWSNPGNESFCSLRLHTVIDYCSRMHMKPSPVLRAI